jgi:2-methylisocitrate lyase-like PEP mutase family enzyme
VHGAAPSVGRVSSTALNSKATELLRLHTDPELLVVVNVWDVVSATVVAAQPGCRAIATASHSIAATLGYPDNEHIPVDLMIDMCGRIAAAVELPVTADLEAGYGDPGETVRKAIGAGVVGANLEDRMQPLPDAVTAVRAAVEAGQAEGVPFVLNARTDAFLRGRDRDPAEVLADAIERGRAFLDAGAACVFVPGLLDEPTVGALVEGIGQRRVSVINVPGSLPQQRLAELGVARVSFGPFIQRAALTRLAELAADLLAGAALPDGIQALN